MFTDVGGVPAVNVTGGGYGYGDGCGMGGGIWAILLLALLGGRGFGHGGFDGHGGGGCNCNKFMELMENQNINSRFDSLQQNMDHNNDCDFQREVEMQIANGFGNANLVSCQGFGGVNQNILESKFTTQLGFAGIQKEIADCCCKELMSDQQTRFEAQKNTCDLLMAGTANTQKILDKMCCNEITELRDKLQAERFQNSQLMQNATLINALRPFPIPAFPSCNPLASHNFGFNNGCGCGPCNGVI